MKLFTVIGILPLLFFACTLPASSEPYSPSCESAVEKLHKARQTLIPSQRTIELARASEQLAYADLAVCAGGGSMVNVGGRFQSILRYPMARTRRFTSIISKTFSP